MRQLPPDLQYAILYFVDHRARASRQQIADELMQHRREMSDLAEANDQLPTTIDDLQDQLAHAMSEKANLKVKPRLEPAPSHLRPEKDLDRFQMTESSSRRH